MAGVRSAVIRGLAPLVRDLVLTGLDLPHIGGLLFLDYDACQAKFPELASEEDPGTIARHPALVQAIQSGLNDLARNATGSSTMVARAIILETPPSPDANEITDKGSLNQRAVMAHRRRKCRLFMSTTFPAHVLVADRKSKITRRTSWISMALPSPSPAAHRALEQALPGFSRQGRQGRHSRSECGGRRSHRQPRSAAPLPAATCSSEESAIAALDALQAKNGIARVLVNCAGHRHARPHRRPRRPDGAGCIRKSDQGQPDRLIQHDASCRTPHADIWSLWQMANAA